MQSCEQTVGQSILQHGLSVAEYYRDIYFHLQYGTPLQKEWRIPDWLFQHKDLILKKLLPLDIIQAYQIFHDCGKPYCLVEDENGKHFPDHARVSSSIWKLANGDDEIGKLIEMDMDIHLLKAKDIDEFAERPEAVTLLLTGLAEVHSNAAMFGGIESVNFKIKWKQIDKRGRAILKYYKK